MRRQNQLLEKRLQEAGQGGYRANEDVSWTAQVSFRRKFNFFQSDIKTIIWTSFVLRLSTVYPMAESCKLRYETRYNQVMECYAESKLRCHQISRSKTFDPRIQCFVFHKHIIQSHDDQFDWITYSR